MTAVQGLLVGSGITLWILILAEAVLRKEAMGFGDVKLMGAIGAVCGWQGSLFALFGGSLLGTLYLVGALIWEKLRPGPGKTTPASPEESEAGEENRIGFGKQLPFGPMLASGAALYLLLLKPWFDAYLAQIVPLFRP
jgi:leader peptidase (prepilin peptidase)/N-methyltransferase